MLNFRIGLGMAAAVQNCVGSSFIDEVASSEKRDLLMGLYRISFFAGMVTQSVISVWYVSYRVLAYVTLALSAMYFLSTYALTETPTRLISISEHEKAKQTLKHFRLGYANAEINFEFEKLKSYAQNAKGYKCASGRRRGKDMLVFCVLNFLTTLTGGITLCTLVTIIFPDNEFVLKKYYPLMGQVMGFGLDLVTPMCISRFSRVEILYAIGAGVTCVNHLLIAFSNYTYLYHSDETFKWVFIVGCVLVCVIYAGLLKPLCRISGYELFPRIDDEERKFVNAMAQVFQVLASVLSYFLYYFVSENLGLPYMYLIFATTSFSLCVLVFFRVLESDRRRMKERKIERILSVECW